MNPMSKTYPLSDEMQAFVSQSERLQTFESELGARRAAYERISRHFTPPQPEGVLVRDASVGAIDVRIYCPAESKPAAGWPVLLYLHGGGWNTGNLDTHDWFAFAILQRLSWAVVAVDYRLAPEAPYPAALGDALSVFRALRAGVVDDALDAARLVVCGDSAGGNLAAALCLALRAANGRQPTAQALVYPVLTARDDLPSMRECADAPILNATGLRAAIESYLPNVTDRDDPLAMPLCAERLDGLADAFIGVAEFDPLRDHGRAYAAALRAAGGRVTDHFGAGLVHAALRAKGCAQVDAFYDALCRFLRDY